MGFLPFGAEPAFAVTMGDCISSYQKIGSSHGSNRDDSVFLYGDESVFDPNDVARYMRRRSTVSPETESSYVTGSDIDSRYEALPKHDFPATSGPRNFESRALGQDEPIDLAEFRIQRDYQLLQLKGKELEVEVARLNVEPLISGAPIEKGAVPPLWGEPAVFEIKALPAKPKGKNHFRTKAIRHPLLSDAKKEIEAGGYKLVVDTTLPYSDRTAYIDHTKRILAIGPNTSWTVFERELSQFKINRFLEKREKYLKQVKSGEAKQVLPPELIRILGRRTAGRLQLLESQAMSDDAVRESLALEVELRSMGFARFTTREGDVARQRQIRLQVEELLRIKTRTPEQEKRLQEAQAKKLRLDQYPAKRDHFMKSTLPLAAGGVILVGGTSVATQILYSENHDEMYVQTDDGSWRKYVAEVEERAKKAKEASKERSN